MILKQSNIEALMPVTNFDLSTYIKWLRPGAKSAASQEPKSSIF